MSYRNPAIVACFVVGLLGASSSQASAQQLQPLTIADALAAARSQPALAAQQTEIPSPVTFSRPYRSEGRPSWMIPMHIMTAAMQGLDAHSTFAAFDVGAVEANPLVASFAHNRPAFTALKVGVAAGIVYTTDRLARRHPIRAFITAAAINSVYAMVAANNYRVARGLR
jgi:hypothetical protein